MSRLKGMAERVVRGMNRMISLRMVKNIEARMGEKKIMEYIVMEGEILILLIILIMIYICHNLISSIL